MLFSAPEESLQTQESIQWRDADIEMSQFILDFTSDPWQPGASDDGYDEIFQTQAVQLAFNGLSDPSAAVVLSLTSAGILNIVSSGFQASYDPTP